MQCSRVELGGRIEVVVVAVETSITFPLFIEVEDNAAFPFLMAQRGR